MDRTNVIDLYRKQKIRDSEELKKLSDAITDICIQSVEQGMSTNSVAALLFSLSLRAADALDDPQMMRHYFYTKLVEE